MKKVFLVALLLVFVTCFSFAIGQKEQKKNEIKIALIVSSTIDDKGWCQAMHDGITQAINELPKGTVADYKAVEIVKL